jgi:hypothetical protein
MYAANFSHLQLHMFLRSVSHARTETCRLSLPHSNERGNSLHGANPIYLQLHMFFLTASVLERCAQGHLLIISPELLSAGE